MKAITATDFAEKFRDDITISVVEPTRGILVVHFTDPRVFKAWLSQDETFKTNFINFFRKSLGIPIAFLSPGMKLQIIQVKRETWKKIWHILSGQKRTDRLIKRAKEETKC